MPLPEKLRLQHFLRRFHRPLVRVEDFAETFMVYLRSKGTLPEAEASGEKGGVVNSR